MWKYGQIHGNYGSWTDEHQHDFKIKCCAKAFRGEVQVTIMLKAFGCVEIKYNKAKIYRLE